MTAFDYAVLIIVGFSILLSVMRGMLRELLALLSWVVAFWVGNIFSVQLAPMLPAAIPNDALRYLAAFVILFALTLLVMSLITIALSETIKALGLGPADRLLGTVFGLLRGMLIVTILVLLSGLTSLPHQPFWRNAMFSAPLEAVAQMTLPWLPADLAKRINYE